MKSKTINNNLLFITYILTWRLMPAIIILKRLERFNGPQIITYLSSLSD